MRDTVTKYQEKPSPQRKLPEISDVTNCKPEVIDLINCKSPPDCVLQIPVSVEAVVPSGISIHPISSTTKTSTKTVSLPATVAGALASVANSQHLTTKTKVTLELSDGEIVALKTLGIIQEEYKVSIV